MMMMMIIIIIIIIKIIITFFSSVLANRLSLHVLIVNNDRHFIFNVLKINYIFNFSRELYDLSSFHSKQ